ncbi:hypothetical protein MZD04_gp415 [Pseudomonas phage Psa21]|uniref:Uncharacterized protein n=1 Tax=Pseudomonas phage Psa21 TaxID=2530023 RepID=A0A481W6A7_9CAUD|nr:hypothetical protein MZD04_gp415 [Pseudomonas phage Psa21]QBJ02933.1 hypothetical protein PSA21_411 [Pseudomonas phage Psa21]
MTKEHVPTCWKIMGYSSHEEFLRKARARTVIITRILRAQMKAQQVTPEMLNRVVNL